MMVKNIMMMAAALVAVPIIMAAPAQAKDKEYCREYTKTVVIGGRSERAYGTACYKPDGSWEIVSLEGGYRARDQVRDIIYNDIHKKKHRRGGKTVIIEKRYKPYSYYHAPRYHSSHHKVIHRDSPSFSWAHYGRNYHRRHGHR